MSPASPSTLAIKAATSALAAAIAASSAAHSSGGGPALFRNATGAPMRMIGPMKMPPEAARPLSSTGCRIGVTFLEVALNERGQGGNRGMSIAAAGAKMKNGVFSRLRRHHLYDALCIDPRAVGRQRQFDVRREGLGKLG